jgi:hypothetical protein
MQRLVEIIRPNAVKSGLGDIRIDAFVTTHARGEGGRMQMITEVGAEQNTMTIIMTPSEFVEMARTIGARGGEKEKT